MDPYESYENFKQWREEDFGRCTAEERVYFQKELQLIEKCNLHKKRVVEIGFGNGSFATWATQSGCDYLGFEVIPSLLRIAKKFGFSVFDAKDQLHEAVSCESVDYVFAWDVFEHLNGDQIFTKLSECHRVLKNGGKIVARVPSGDSPFSAPLQYGDRTHKTFIGSSMIRQFAEETGFTVVDIRAPAFPLSGLGTKTFVRRSIVSVVRGILSPIISKIFMGGQDVVLTQNMVFVLKKDSA